MPSSSRLRFARAALAALAALAGVAGLVGLGIADAGCGGGALARDVGGDEGGASGEQAEAGSGTADADTPTTTIRIAHLAPGLGAVDFCYRAVNTGTFEGPVFGGSGGAKKDGGADAGTSGDADAAAGVDGGSSADADADADASDGVGARGPAYRTVSTYTTLAAAGPITLAIVLRGSGTCSSPLARSDVTLDAGKLSTVALVRARTVDGGDAALELVAFTDDRATKPSEARARLVHAALGDGARAPAGRLAVRVVSGDVVTLADALEPRRASSASATVPVDALGYATVAPVPPPAAFAISDASDAGSGWQSAPRDLGLTGGSLHTGFVLTGESASFEVLWCADASTSAERTACEVVR